MMPIILAARSEAESESPGRSRLQAVSHDSESFSNSSKLCPRALRICVRTMIPGPDRPIRPGAGSARRVRTGVTQVGVTQPEAVTVELARPRFRSWAGFKFSWSQLLRVPGSGGQRTFIENSAVACHAASGFPVSPLARGPRGFLAEFAQSGGCPPGSGGAGPAKSPF